MNGGQIDAVHNAFAEKDAQIEQLEAALKISASNIADLNERSAALTKALVTSMLLMDELITENGRLCSASSEPPNVRLFAAKNSFTLAMKRLLGEEPDQPPTASKGEKDEPA